MVFSSFSGIKEINNLMLIAWATAIIDASFVRCATYGIAQNLQIGKCRNMRKCLRSLGCGSCCYTALIRWEMKAGEAPITTKHNLLGIAVFVTKYCYTKRFDLSPPGNSHKYEYWYTTHNVGSDNRSDCVSEDHLMNKAYKMKLTLKVTDRILLIVLWFARFWKITAHFLTYLVMNYLFKLINIVIGESWWITVWNESCPVEHRGNSTLRS